MPCICGIPDVLIPVVLNEDLRHFFSSILCAVQVVRIPAVSDLLVKLSVDAQAVSLVLHRRGYVRPLMEQELDVLSGLFE